MLPGVGGDPGGAGLPDTGVPHLTTAFLFIDLFIYLAFNINLDLTHSLPPVLKWLEQYWKSAGRGLGRQQGLAGAGQGGWDEPSSQFSMLSPWPSLWMSHLVPTLSPLYFRSSGATDNQKFPFILAGADESGRKPSPTALSPLLSIPKPIPGFATNVRNFHLPRRCETWQFCSLQRELQPLQNANKQTNAN